MTQRDRILHALEAAGSKGVRSDAFIKDFMPRAAARIQELKDEGYDISSEREGKYVRWTLNVGSSTEGRIELRGGEVDETLGVASGVAASSSLLAPASEARARTIPSAYSDVWVEEAA